MSVYKKRTRDAVFAGDLVKLMFKAMKHQHEPNQLETVTDDIGALLKRFRESILEDSDDRV